MSKTVLNPISYHAIKELMKFYLEHSTRISKEAIDIMRSSVAEYIKWITFEAEKLARFEGKNTISGEHVREAINLFLGGGEK